MSSPEELAVEADLTSDAAKVLEEEALKLEKQGLLIGAQGKLQEAQYLRAKAMGLQQRMLVLQQQRSGVRAYMQSSVFVQCALYRKMQLLGKLRLFTSCCSPASETG